MDIKVAVFLLGAFGSGFSNAQKVVLSEIKAPDNFENIHVVKIASDANASDFVIFIKHHVPLHKHVEHTETIYVLEGRGEFQLGKTKLHIGPGDYIKVPQGVPHSLKVLSSEPLKAISIQAPEFFGKDRVAVE